MEKRGLFITSLTTVVFMVFSLYLTVEVTYLHEALKKSQEDVRHFKGKVYFMESRYEEAMQALHDDYGMALYELQAQLDRCPLGGPAAGGR